MTRGRRVRGSARGGWANVKKESAVFGDPPLDIYLDQNQWIPLARAFHGRDSDPVLKQVSELASRSVSSGDVRFPISRLHLMEATKTADDAQRRRLIEAFLHFGRGWVVRPVELLHAEELLCWLRGKTPRASSAVDRGLLAAFSGPTAAALQLGVSPQEVEDLNRFGDSPGAWYFALTMPGFHATVDQIQAAAQKYASQVEEVRGPWSKLPRTERRTIFAEGLVRDTIASLQPPSSELQCAISRLSALRSGELLDVIARIPTMDVLFVLSERKTRDLSRATDPNDLWDLGFLAAVVPYCHVVVTEKYWTHLARTTRLDAKYNTRILSRLENLLPVLEERVNPGRQSGNGGGSAQHDGQPRGPADG